MAPHGMAQALARLQAGLLWGLIWLLRCLTPAAASNLGGAVARGLGPLLPVSRVARDNLAAALPEYDAAERQRILLGVWENLGRTFCELPHLGRIGRDTQAGPGWSLQGLDVVQALRAEGGPIIFFGGHIANWEIWGRVASEMGFIPNGLIYRAPSNAHADLVLARLRHDVNPHGTLWFPKGAAGARQAMAHLKAGHALLMLTDQKMNDGIEARFFGLPAMSPPALAALALRYDAKVVPATCRRVGPARFVMRVQPPLVLPHSGNRNADIAALTQAVNDTLEAQIRAEPAQWLWLHRRWPKEVIAAALQRNIPPAKNSRDVA